MACCHRRIGAVAVVCLIIGGALPKLGELVVVDMYPLVKQKIASAITPAYTRGGAAYPDYVNTAYSDYVSAPITK